MTAPQTPSKSSNMQPGGSPDADRNTKDEKKHTGANRSPTPGANDNPKNPGMKMPVSGDEKADRDRADPAEQTATQEGQGPGRAGAGAPARSGRTGELEASRKGVSDAEDAVRAAAQPEKHDAKIPSSDDNSKKSPRG